MPMSKREWIAPGIILAVMTLGANFVSAWAVDRYRQDDTEKALIDLRTEVRKSNETTNGRIDKLDGRLDQMQRDGAEVVRLQERNAQLKDAIAELRTELTSQTREWKTGLEVEAMKAQKFREELYRKGVL